MIRIKPLSLKIFVEVYDGPGTLSGRLKKLNEGYYTTSFQCIIYIYGLWAVTKANELLTLLSFSSKWNRISGTVNINSSETASFHYKNSKLYTFRNVHLLKISVQPHSLINVTVVQIHHNYGYRNVNCTIGGLTAYDLGNHSLSEKSTVCFPHKDIYKYRNIYSQTSNMLLVTYSYREYGTFNLTVRLSTTMCTIYTINPCHRIKMLPIPRQHCSVYQFVPNLVLADYKQTFSPKRMVCGYNGPVAIVEEIHKTIEVSIIGYFSGTFTIYHFIYFVFSTYWPLC